MKDMWNGCEGGLASEADEDVAPFLGGIDEQALALQLERLEGTAVH